MAIRIALDLKGFGVTDVNVITNTGKTLKSLCGLLVLKLVIVWLKLLISFYGIKYKRHGYMSESAGDGFVNYLIQHERQLDELTEFLAHGSEPHRRWLADAIRAFFNNKPRPEPYE